MSRPEYAKVAPETVDSGDTIEVVYPEDKGVTKRVRGVVGKRESFASGHRRLYTPEGGILLSWMPGTETRVYRIARAQAEPTPLFELDGADHIRSVN